jgi:hypothetical protein
MSFVLVSCLLIADVSPPIVGRPVDFSSAIGGPLVVEQTAEPTTLTAAEPLTLTVRITGPGNLRDIPRPELAKLDAYKAFAVEELDDRFVPGNPPRREFRYRLRPRTADVKEVPRLKFVYFNPRLPAARGYQTTYAAAVPLTVKPRTPPVPADVPAEVPDWMLVPAAAEELYAPEPGLVMKVLQRVFGWFGIPFGEELPDRVRSWPVAVVAILLPPVVCMVWFVLWRRANPDAARRASIRRSRAAAIALRSLRTAAGDQAPRVAAALLGYLHDRTGLPAAATTPAEVAHHLHANGCPPTPAAAVVGLLRQCDEARFAPTRTDNPALSDAAERLVLEWEAAPWSPHGSFS